MFARRSPGQRAAIVLQYYRGLTLDEIAEGMRRLAAVLR